jgi:hypothetical protein
VTSVGPLGNEVGGESLYVDMITWPAASKRGDRSWERGMKRGGDMELYFEKETNQ